MKYMNIYQLWHCLHSVRAGPNEVFRWLLRSIDHRFAVVLCMPWAWPRQIWDLQCGSGPRECPEFPGNGCRADLHHQQSSHVPPLGDWTSRNAEDWRCRAPSGRVLPFLLKETVLRQSPWKPWINTITGSQNTIDMQLLEGCEPHVGKARCCITVRPLNVSHV